MCFVVTQQPLKFEPLVISFLATFFIYNLNKKTDILEDSINYPERRKFVDKYGTTLF